MSCCGGTRGHKETYSVQGISCNHCAMAIKRALGDLDAVRNVLVSVDSGMVTVISDEKICREEIAAAVAKAGYTLA